MKPAVRVIGFLLVSTAMVVAGSAAAWADEPVGPAWPGDDSGRSTLDTLLFFVGGTAAIYLLVVLFALLTARNNYVPPPPSSELEKAPSNTPAHH